VNEENGYMKTQKKKLSEKLWKLCVEYIRLRDGMTCQWCGKHVEKSNAHTSHVIPKSHGNILRYDPFNLKLLCYHCHLQRWHLNPVEAGEWFKKEFPERLEYLESHKNDTCKLTEDLLNSEIKDYERMIKEISTQYK